MDFYVSRKRLGPFNRASNTPFAMDLRTTRTLVTHLTLAAKSVRATGGVTRALVTGPGFGLDRGCSGVFAAAGGDRVVFDFHGGADRKNRGLCTLFAACGSPVGKD